MKYEFLKLHTFSGDLDFSEDKTDCLAAHRFNSVVGLEKLRLKAMAINLCMPADIFPSQFLSPQSYMPQQK